MKQILHLCCSPRGQAAESLRLSRKLVDRLCARAPGATVTTRVIGGSALGHVDGDYALSQQSAQDISQEGSMRRSEALVRELEDADAVVIGTPVHNFTVPSTLKAWLDHVVRVRRTFDLGSHGKIPLLHDRPVFIAISAGGRFSGEGARQPDFLTPYLRAVLGMIGLHDLTFFSVQGTAFGPDALASARARADEALRAHFDSRIFGE